MIVPQSGTQKKPARELSTPGGKQIQCIGGPSWQINRERKTSITLFFNLCQLKKRMERGAYQNGLAYFYIKNNQGKFMEGELKELNIKWIKRSSKSNKTPLDLMKNHQLLLLKCRQHINRCSSKNLTQRQHSAKHSPLINVNKNTSNLKIKYIISNYIIHNHIILYTRLLVSLIREASHWPALVLRGERAQVQIAPDIRSKKKG